MKKIIWGIFLLVFLSTFLFLITSDYVSILDIPKENVKVEIKELGYDSFTFKVNNINDNDLTYYLKNNNTLIKEGKVSNENISVSNLKEGNEYKLEILNNDELLWSQKVLTKKKTIIRFGGDVMATSAFANYIREYGVDYMWADVSPLLQSADYSIVNLETSVSTRGKDTKPVGFGFRSKPETLEGFRNAGIDLVDIANNHILDYGKDAFLDTMKYLNDYNIKYSGAGKNIDEALTPVYVLIDGIKVGFLSAEGIARRSTWAATATNPGAVSLNKNREQLMASIKQADKECDVLILMLHWGVEYSSVPTNDQVTLAHQFIDAGVDVIIGNHPHVLQGIEIYKDKPIYYSVGNFLFLKKNMEAGYTAVFELTLDGKEFYSSRIYPVNIKACKANLLKEDSDLYLTIMNKMRKLSSAMGTTMDDKGYIMMNN